MTSNDIDDAIRASDAGKRLADRRPLTNDVSDVVMDMLMNHSLPPGARLNIDSLARTLGVSPTPVREALARIESEGLIIKEPQRGYTVAPLIGLGPAARAHRAAAADRARRCRRGGQERHAPGRPARCAPSRAVAAPAAATRPPTAST